MKFLDETGAAVTDKNSVQGLIRFLKERGSSDVTIAHRMAVLKSFFSYLTSRGIVPKRALPLVEKYKTTRKIISIPSDDEVNLFLKSIEDEYRLSTESIGAGLGFSGTTEFLLQPKPSTEPGALALADVNSVDRVAVFPYSKDLRRASDILMYVSVAVPFALAAMHDMDGFPAAGVVSLEALSLANGTKNAVKILLPRYRPYMYTGGAADVDRREDVESFPSSHATIAFTSAALSAFLFTSYYPDSPLLVPFLVADYALAGLTASLRVASGMHFVTDAVVGAVIGTAFGFLLPVLHQR